MIEFDDQILFTAVVIYGIMFAVKVVHDGIDHSKVEQVVVIFGYFVRRVISLRPVAVGSVVKSELAKSISNQNK